MKVKFLIGLFGLALAGLVVVLSYPSLRALAQYSDEDPDMPSVFRRAKGEKEKFMLDRAAGVGLKRGLEKGKPVDPKIRISGIQRMEFQEAARNNLPESAARDSLLAAWTPIGPAPIPNGQTVGISTPVSGRTISIAIHPTNPNIVYVGTAQGGLYRSTDGGTNWTAMLDNALSLAIGAIAIAPSQPDTIYVGTGEGNFSLDSFFGVGVYRITGASGGSPVITGPLNKNASNADIFTGTAIGKIVVHPTDPATIFVASTSGFSGIGAFYTVPAATPKVGIYRSTNATSASPVFSHIGPLGPPNDDFSVHDIVIDPLNPNFLVANLVVSSGGIYVSTNALATTPTFTNRQTFTGGTSTVNTEFAIQRSAGATNPTIYAATGNGGGRVLRSTDGGVTWTERIDNNFCGGQCFYDIAVAVDPNDPNKVYLGGDPSVVFAHSSTGGSTFTESDFGLHGDTHVIAVSQSQPSTLYLGTDGGIYKSTNAGVDWSVLNNSQYSATQFMSLALHPTDPNFTIGGTQDNGTNFYRPNATWFRADFGDGGYSVIDQNATDTTNVRMYHTYFNNGGLQGYGTVSSTGAAADNGWSFRGCQDENTTTNGITCNGTTLFYAPMTRGPGNPNTIYFGTDRLYRSADTGLTHTVVSQNPINADDPISAIGVSRQNDNVRIVGLAEGGIWGTTTGSSTLTNLDAGNTVPNSFVARAVIDPNNVNTAYVTLSAMGLTNVWRTTNLNSGSPTWIAAAGSGGNALPQVPVSAFAIDPTNSVNLYAGTDIGVYTSTDSGANWTPLGTGLPRVAVFDMAVTPGATRKLRIATHGRGMWETELPVAGAPTISINDVTANEGNTGNTAFTFNVTLSTASAQAVTVAYATANGTATAGSDYTAANGTVTFNPNETTKPVTVNVTGDTVVELTENFFVNLTNPTGGATIADNQGTGTITNDDSSPTPPPSPTPTPADGDLDQDFVSRLIGGVAEGTGLQYSYVKDILMQPDGKAVVVGEFISFASRLQRGIARINADGSPDYAFHPRVNGDIYGVTLQQDGKIVIGGSFTEVGGLTRNRVARLNADGSLDTSFQDPAVSSTVNEVAIQGDRIVIGGPFASIANVPTRHIGRLTATGVRDATFSSPLFITETVGALVVDPTGRLYVGGSFQLGTQGSGFIRLNENGSIDPTFTADIGSGLTHAVRLATGHFLLGGMNGGILRIDANGNDDNSFLVSGVSITVADFVVQGDGKIVAAGSVGGSGPRALVRLSATGEFDPTYLPNIGSGDVVALAIQPDDKVYAGGNFDSVRGQTRNSIVRLNPDASLDLLPEDISLGSVENVHSNRGIVRAIAIQPDRKILVGGYATSAGGITRQHVARINLDGTIDTSFQNPLISGRPPGGANIVEVLAVQPLDGKILVGGDFQVVNGAPRRRLARFHANGLLDTSFNATVSDAVTAIAVQPDEKILIGGFFSQVDGQDRSRMARLNPNGSLDPSFNRGSNFSIPQSIDVLPGGKILASGSAVGVPSGLFRYNSDGTRDTTWTIASADTVNRSVLTPDDKIIITGTFSTVGGIPRPGIARLNTNGTLDTSFAEINLSGGSIYDAAVEPNGKVVFVGNFGDINGQNRRSIARLNADGSLDPNFIARTAAESAAGSSEVFRVLRQQDGRILVGGAFRSINRVGADYIARLYNGFTPGCSFAVNPTDRTFSQAAATSSVNVIAGNGCDWTASAFPNWITITSGSSGSGNGTINYSVAANTTGLPRTGTIDVAGLAGAAVHTITQQGSNPTPSPTPTVGPSPTPTVGPSPTPTVAPSPTPGNVIINYTGPAVTIPDNVAGGVNVVTNVATACTITDMNFRFDGTPSADPASTTVGLSHSWIGDLIIKLTSPAGTTVTMIDRPGVPALNSSGCNSNNLAQVTIDDDGGFPAIENQCGSDNNAAFPSGTFSPNNPLSAFDGQSTAGNWTLNVSDNAGQDTGSIRAFTLVFSCPASNPTPTPSPTRTPTPTPTPTPVATPTPTPTPPACSFAANPTSRSIPAAGGTSSFAIVTPAGCGWTASAGASWVTLTSPSSGTGPTTLNYTITANSDISPRTTTIDFGGVGGIAEHTITQAGNAASPSPTPTVAPSPTPTATPIVRDGGYEMTSAVAGTNPHWTSTSTAFGSSLCFGTSVCGSGTAPRSGSGWVWFDGTGSGAAAEAGTAVQSVTMAAGSTAILTFYMRVASVSAPSSSTMTVTIDGTVVQTFTEPATAEAAYSLRTVDLSAFANGQPRQLSLNYNRPGGATGSDNFLLDDVTLTATAQPFATVTGRVLTPTGTAVRNAPVSMINAEGVRVVATTSSFGVYTFNNVATGRTYTMTVASKRYRFSPRTMEIGGNLTGVDFVGLE